MPFVALFIIGATCVLADQTPLTVPEFSDDQFTQLYERGMEQEPAPFAFGAKFMTGGAGEGYQALEPNGQFVFRQHVKSDQALPEYCQPPNPCPMGYTAKDGCLEEFENTAEFSKKYQEAQDCLCDKEHMHSCPETREEAMDNMPEEIGSLSDAIDMYLHEQGVDEHGSVRAKKGHWNEEAQEPLLHRAKKG